MNNGMNATCIAYRGCDDIDVRFEDGTIVAGKTKSNFLKGNIGYPKTNKDLSIGSKIYEKQGTFLRKRRARFDKLTANQGQLN